MLFFDTKTRISYCFFVFYVITLWSSVYLMKNMKGSINQILFILLFISPFGLSMAGSDLIFETGFEVLLTDCSGEEIPVERQNFPSSFLTATGGIAFGQATGVIINYSLDKNKYTGMIFTAPASAMNKKIDFEEGTPGNGGPAAYTVSISKCIGDFTVHLDQPRCKVGGITPSLKWSTNVNNPALFSCILQPGEVYYLNIVHSTNEINNYVPSSCPSNSGCGVLLNELIN